MNNIAISIRALYKIFGPTPQKMMKHVNTGITKEQLLEKFNHVLGLNNINLDIEKNKIQVLMGLSGSGKSTLIRHINRLIDPTHGSIKIADANILDYNKKQLIELRRHKVSMVFQTFALMPHMTILENIALGLSISGYPVKKRKDSAQHWLNAVGLSGYGNRYPKHLSGGMRQRVGLARALATETDVLLMDEPFSALDPLIRREVQTLLLDIQSKLNKTIIFITHDLEEGVKLGDRIAIINDGKIEQNSAPLNILLHPQSHHVANFVTDVNLTKVIKAQDIMDELQSSQDDNAMIVQATDPVDVFINRILMEQPKKIVVHNELQQAIGCLRIEKLAELLNPL